MSNIMNNKNKVKYPSQYVVLGQYSVLQGDYDKAVDLYRKALEKMPCNRKVLYFLANAYFRKAVNDKTDKARSYRNAFCNYEKIIRSEPEGPISNMARKKMAELRKEVDIDLGE